MPLRETFLPGTEEVRPCVDHQRAGRRQCLGAWFLKNAVGLLTHVPVTPDGTEPIFREIERGAPAGGYAGNIDIKPKP